MLSQSVISLLLLLLLLLTAAAKDQIPTRKMQVAAASAANRKFIHSKSANIPTYEYHALPSDPLSPRNVHLAFGDNETSIVVTWSTRNSTASVVEIVDSSGKKRQLLGVARRFTDGGAAKATQFIHRATAFNLIRGSKYSYRVGNGINRYWSDLFRFTVPSPKYSPRFAVFGDMGLENAQSLPRLLYDVKHGMYDAILHVGDFAYNLDDDNATVGDQFMQMIQPIASSLPYMTCVGNHEQRYNFSNYKSRFSMPKAGGDGESMFYSFNMGPAHIISISTEFYFYVNYGFKQMQTQFHWLRQDLTAANQQRHLRPWIIVIGHRPMYCSNNDGNDCTFGALTLREGFLAKYFALEPLLMEFGVDLAFWAHEHTYERTWPLNRLQVANGSRAEPYTNPKGTVHVVTGSAGCKERHDSFGEGQYFSAFHSTDYGYTRMHILNATHLQLQQVSDDRGGAVIDAVTIVQWNHGPFP